MINFKLKSRTSWSDIYTILNIQDNRPLTTNKTKTHLVTPQEAQEKKLQNGRRKMLTNCCQLSVSTIQGHMFVNMWNKSRDTHPNESACNCASMCVCVKITVILGTCVCVCVGTGAVCTLHMVWICTYMYRQDKRAIKTAVLQSNLTNVGLMRFRDKNPYAYNPPKNRQSFWTAHQLIRINIKFLQKASCQLAEREQSIPCNRPWQVFRSFPTRR